MASDRIVIPGVVKNGLIVPQGHAPLPEGAQVEIVIPVPELPPDLRAEFDAWERAGDEAWALIDQWGPEGRSVPLVTSIGSDSRLPPATSRVGGGPRSSSKTSPMRECCPSSSPFR